MGAAKGSVNYTEQGLDVILFLSILKWNLDQEY